MANFKLYLLTLKNNEHEIFSDRYLASLISEFHSQIDTKMLARTNDKREHLIYNTNNTFCYTYDEQLSLHQNSQKELTFKMDFKVYRDDRLEDNPYAQNLIIGSQLLLEDQYKRQHLFTVKNIDVELSNINTVCTYSCQDSFTFQLSKQNDGYEITNSIDDEDFIGAHTIDWWVQKKIVPECFVYYNYIPLAEKGYTDDYYKQTIPFSGSGTADSILISLGETLDLNLHVHEKLEGDNLIREFWFEPTKNPEISGLSYSPYADLQKLSLSHSGDSLTSVLNVYGGTFGDERITLLPAIPQLFKQVFASEKWMTTPYYQGIFNDIVYGQTIKIDFNIENDIECQYDNNQFLIVNISNFLKNAINWLDFYTDYKFATIDNSAWATIGYTDSNSYYALEFANTKNWFLGSAPKEVNDSTEENNQITSGTLYTTLEEIKTQLSLNSDIYLYIPNARQPLKKATISGLFYLSFYRQPTEEETTFAKIAEACPWLENKLLDFSYFTNHRLLNSYEYGILIQQIYNNLRQINGRLIYLADSYYKALSEKTKFLAQLDERVTNLGAKFTAEFLQPYLNQKQIREEDVQDFLLDYRTLYAVPESRTSLFNYDEIYTEYLNKYLNAEQRFLKNIYDFREYWNAPVSIEGAKKIYQYKIDLSQMEGYEGYSFNNIKTDASQLKVEEDYDENTSQPKKIIFSVKTDQPIIIVNNNETDNVNYYKNFKWAKYAENDFIPCTAENHNQQYDRQKTYYLKDMNSSQFIEYKYDKMVEYYLEQLAQSGKYYFRNQEVGEYSDFLSFSDIIDFYSKFSANALRKLVKYDSISDQDNFSQTSLRNWIDGYATSKRTTEDYQYYRFLHASNFPLQEVYVKDYVYKLEDQTYKQQGGDQKWQPVSVVNANNYMTFYKRVSLTNDQYKTSQTLKTMSKYLFAGNLLGWVPPGLSTLTATVLLGIAYSKISNKNTWWGNDGYTKYDLSLENSLSDFYHKLISYDEMEVNDKKIFASHFYYTASENDYDQYIELKKQDWGDHYFNKWSKFIPGYHQLAYYKHYHYRPSYLRILTGEDHINTADEYLVFIYSTNPNDDVYYFQGEFLTTFKSCLENGNRINSIKYPIFEILSDSFSFKDFNDTSGSLLEILQDQFLFEKAKKEDCCFNLKGTTQYMVIFHKENYQEQAITKDNISNISKDLITYNYIFYDKKNDAIFNPVQVDDFTKDFYLLAAENNLTVDDLTDATEFDLHRKYYKIEDNQIVYYPTIQQIIEDGHNYYFYKDEIYQFWDIANLNGKTKSLTVINNVTDQLETIDFALTDKNLISTIDLTDINNGTFWKRYYNNSDKSLNFLREHTMLIETDLTNYWNQAYNASQLCQYFLPEHWQSVQNNQNNPFQIFKPITNTMTVNIPAEDVEILNCKYLEGDLLKNDKDKWQAMLRDWKVENTEQTYWIYHPNFNYFQLKGFDETINVPIFEQKVSSIPDVLRKKQVKKTVTQFIQVHYVWNMITLNPCYKQVDNTTYDYYKTEENSRYVSISAYPHYSTDSLQSVDIPASYETYELDSTYLPIVTKVQSDNPYKFKLKYFSDSNDCYNYLSEYNAELQDQNKTDNHYQIILLSNRLYLEPFSSLVSKFNLQTDKWVLVPQYASTQDTYFQATEGGITWSTLLQQLYPSKASFPYFDGYYGLYLNYLKPDNFLNNKLSEYNKYKKQHQEAWTQLYKQFASILLEQKYQNEDATNSLELLQMAQLAMKDFNNIEREYGITTIDTFALKGYKGQQINIGDAIALNAEELYTGFDDIKESLKQYLFVTDISYTLRQDTDVNLTVNKIKYQDKMIQQLAKLIK